MVRPLRVSLVTVLLLTCRLASAQDNAPEMTQKDSAPTFQSKVNLVVVPIVVRDSQGRTVANLTKDDFQIFDKGKPQTIASFSVVKRGTRETPAPDPSSPPAAASSAKDNSTASLPSSPERYVAYLFDDLNIQTTDLLYLKKSALAHLANGMASTDRAAIFTTSGQTNLEFTDDKEKLQETVGKIQARSLYQHLVRQCPDISYYMADLIMNKHDPMALTAATQETLTCAGLNPATDMQAAQQMAQSASQQEISIGEQGTRVTLGVIKNVIRRMASKPGQRLIVLASPGFLTISNEATSDKSEILDLAASMNVMISSLNARGLFTTGMDASQQGAYSQLGQQQISRYNDESAIATEDVLSELADGTGGIFFHNNNDLVAGFARVATAPEVSYVLGFSPQAIKPDGSFHRLKITVTNYKDTSIQARRGYYAIKHHNDAEADAKADIEEAVFSREEMRDIPIGLQTQFFKSSENAAKLTVVAKVDLRRLKFKKVDTRNRDDLTVVTVLFDRNGNYITGMTRSIEMRLRDETLTRLSSGISVKENFDVKPGTYVIRLVVRDSEGQAMAAQNGAVEIP